MASVFSHYNKYLWWIWDYSVAPIDEYRQALRDRRAAIATELGPINEGAKGSVGLKTKYCFKSW